MSRPLTARERAVLEALPAADFPGAEALRPQAADVEVVGGCACGCPSVDFRSEAGIGLHIRVNAGIRGVPHDGQFLFTIGGHLGGIEYVGNSEGEDPAELPDPSLLVIEPA